MPRYINQESIRGWDQNKIESAKVWVKFSQPQSQIAKNFLVGSMAIGLGQSSNGSLELSEELNSYEWEIINEYKGKTKINSQPISEYDLFVELTNGPSSKYKLKSGSYQYFISCSANSKKLSMLIFSKNLTEKEKFEDDFKSYLGFVNKEFYDKEQNKAVSLICAGIALDCANYLIQKKPNLENILRYDFEFPEIKTKFENKKVLLLGAGGIGTFIAKALLDCGGVEKLVISDFDEVEDRNLNRQIFYASEGSFKSGKKAEILAEKLNKFANKKFAEPNISVFDPNSEKNNYDAIFCAVDTFIARVVANEYALSRKIPLITTGCNPESAVSLIWVCGKTPCLREASSYYKTMVQNCAGDDKNKTAIEFYKQNYGQHPNSCANSPDPQIVTTNMLAGGLAVIQFGLLDDFKGKLPYRYNYQILENGKLNLDECLCSKNEDEASPCKCYEGENWLNKQIKEIEVLLSPKNSEN